MDAKDSLVILLPSSFLFITLLRNHQLESILSSYFILPRLDPTSLLPSLKMFSVTSFDGSVERLYSRGWW